MRGTRLVLCSSLACALACASALGAGASGSDWAAPQIRDVTDAGVLGTSPSAFAPSAKLTQSALAAAIRATDALQHPAVAPAPAAPPTLLSTVAPNATVGGALAWVVDAPGRTIDHVDFAVDGTGAGTSTAAPFGLTLDTRTLGDGPHALAVNASFHGGGSAIATWSITVANAPGALLSPPSGPVSVGIAKSSSPASPTTPT